MKVGGQVSTDGLVIYLVRNHWYLVTVVKSKGLETCAGTRVRVWRVSGYGMSDPT